VPHNDVPNVTLIDVNDQAIAIERRNFKKQLALFDGRSEFLAEVA
jgi:hypothetical protein